MTAQEFDATFQEEFHVAPIIETEYDGMEAPHGFSEPQTDIDFTSPQV